MYSTSETAIFKKDFRNLAALFFYRITYNVIMSKCEAISTKFVTFRIHLAVY